MLNTSIATNTNTTTNVDPNADSGVNYTNGELTGPTEEVDADIGSRFSLSLTPEQADARDIQFEGYNQEGTGSRYNSAELARLAADERLGGGATEVRDAVANVGIYADVADTHNQLNGRADPDSILSGIESLAETDQTAGNVNDSVELHQKLFNTESLKSEAGQQALSDVYNVNIADGHGDVDGSIQEYYNSISEDALYLYENANNQEVYELNITENVQGLIGEFNDTLLDINGISAQPDANADINAEEVSTQDGSVDTGSTDDITNVQAENAGLDAEDVSAEVAQQLPASALFDADGSEDISALFAKASILDQNGQDMWFNDINQTVADGGNLSDLNANFVAENYETPVEPIDQIIASLADGDFEALVSMLGGLLTGSDNTGNDFASSEYFGGTGDAANAAQDMTGADYASGYVSDIGASQM